MSRSAVILFAHGAREPEWARPFESVRDRLRSEGLRVEVAYLEIMTPSLEDAAGVLETVTRTCASVLERIEDNRRDTFEAADAVAQFLSCPDARAETTSSHPHATAMEPR